MKSNILIQSLFLFCSFLFLGCDEDSMTDSDEYTIEMPGASYFVDTTIVVEVSNWAEIKMSNYNQLPYDHYHVAIEPRQLNADFGSDTYTHNMVVVSLPPNITVDRDSVLLQGVSSDMDKVILYTLLTKDTNRSYHSFEVFELKVKKDMFDTSDFITTQVGVDTFEVFDRIAYPILENLPSSSGSAIDHGHLPEISSSRIDKDDHNRSIAPNDYLILADMPDSNSFSQRSRFAMAKIAVGLEEKKRVYFDSAYVFNDAGDTYYAFDFSLGSTNIFLSKKSISIFDVPVDRATFDTSDFYMIRLLGTNGGGEKKKRVLVAHSNGIPELINTRKKRYNSN